jgi:thioredoxin 1
MEINTKELKEKITNGEKVIVEFWAQWCGPCRMMKPVFESVAKENQSGVQMYTMDVDSNRELAGELGIRSIPTVKVFSNGQLVETKVGMLQEGHIKGMLNDLING